MIHSTTISGLRTTIFADEGMDEVLVQTSAVNVDVWIKERRVTCVLAPDGITFSGQSGTLSRPDNYNVTGLCDLEALLRQVMLEKREREEHKLFSRRMSYELERLERHV